MKCKIDQADLLKLINRNKGKTLEILEEINCPDAYLEIIRRRLDYFRNDLIALLIEE